MARPPHICPNKGCSCYALGGDDEQEGAQHLRRSGRHRPGEARGCSSSEVVFAARRKGQRYSTGKKTPGGAGTLTGHSDTRITQTNLTSAIQTSPTHDPGDNPRGRTDRPTADSEEAAPSEPAAPGTVTADDRSSHRRRVGRGAPRLRVGTAMAVAGAMPMVLAVDASPLTQLDAELPSGAHRMPIGSL